MSLFYPVQVSLLSGEDVEVIDRIINVGYSLYEKILHFIPDPKDPKRIFASQFDLAPIGPDSTENIGNLLNIFYGE